MDVNRVVTESNSVVEAITSIGAVVHLRIHESEAIDTDASSGIAQIGKFGQTSLSACHCVVDVQVRPH